MSGAHISSHAAHGASHGSLKSYVVGFILSLGLTALSFGAVMTGVLPRDMILPAITLLAVVQLLVQLLCFLHLGTAPEQRNNTVIFLLAEHNNVVKALPSDRTDQPFGISVLPWGARRCRPVTNAH
ncbi:cytochrome o ubiquinol oxidase operon protein cyoD [Bradyrhizobium erythrophlei]|uniref:Cytochrome bo(3) ubiquinol oxidase subunit 4 n=1 Tax=Bradyrhizobium erythrophlei TaxID=1437360 RepID=A0A1M5Y0D2_9BRAD|nr:cytochrome o ubiquinol oxidase operon protein cyoD [Bradyrhizobium erythrophlei]